MLQDQLQPNVDLDHIYIVFFTTKYEFLLIEIERLTIQIFHILILHTQTTFYIMK